jgi:tRNA pseudouridine13 synthase
VLEDLPLYRELPDELLKTLSEVRIPLLHHRVAFSDPRVAEEARAVLKAESLSVGDFKARVLKRAYLSKGERCLLLFPQDVLVGGEEDDDHFEGRRKMQIAFSLPPGSYATLLLRILTVREL